MPFNKNTGRFERLWNFVDQREAGDDITRSDLDVMANDLAAGITEAAAQTLNYVGEWNPEIASFPASRPSGGRIMARDAFVCLGDGTVGGITFEAGETLVALVPDPGQAYATRWLKLPFLSLAAMMSIADAAQGNAAAAQQIAADFGDLAGAQAGIDAAVDLAEAYAQTPEDTEVPGGAGYSALHYAAKAGADTATTIAAKDAAIAARDVAMASRGIFASTAAGLSKGVVNIASLVGGSGGADGTFALAFSGGAGAGAAGDFVVAGGAVVQVNITNPGTGYTSAPTISFAASSGLTGASATAVIDFRNPVGTYFSVPASGNSSLILYSVDTGPVATEVARYPASGKTLQAMMVAGVGVSSSQVTLGSGSITPSIYRAITPASGTTYEAVAVARDGDLPILQLYASSPTISINAIFDLTAGTCAATAGTASMRYMGGGFWECKAVATATGTTATNIQARPSLTGTLPFTAAGETIWLYSFEARVAGGSNIWASNNPADAIFTKASCTVASAVAPEDLLSEELLEATSAINALDLLLNGALTGWALTEEAGSVTPSLYRSRTWVSGQAFELVGVFKAGARSRVNLFCNTGAVFNGTFNLDTGTCTGTGAAMSYIGNGWYECRITGTASANASGNVQSRIYPASGGQPYTGDGASGIFVQEITLSIAGGSNVFTFSNDFSNAAWTKRDCSVTSGQALYVGIASDLAGSTDDSSAAYSGAKWAALGTSITAQNQYVPVVAEFLGMTAQNLGVSGGSLASGSDAGSLAIYNAISSIAVDSDLVTLEAGINDFGKSNSNIGALGDTTTATFYGAIHAAIVAIMARAPSAKIVFLTPYGGDGVTYPAYYPYTANAKGLTLRQFTTAIRDVCGSLGVPVIDVGEAAGIGPLTAPTYMSDGLHINATGGARYGSYVADGLLRLARAGMLGT